MPSNRKHQFVPLPRDFVLHTSRKLNLTFRDHADFSESTEEIAPLSAEEKKQRLEELRERVKAKRAGQSEIDKEEQKRNEVIFHTKLPIELEHTNN